MPLHDWTRVDAGVFDHFHLFWIAELSRALNDGLLPPGYYALGEPVGPERLREGADTRQVAGGGNPDVLALHEPDPLPPAGGPATAVLQSAPPRTRLVARAERESYTRLQWRLVVRHTSGDRIVAMVEIVSAGHKASVHAWQTVVNKSLAALHRGVHLLILNVHPPTPRDPAGVHGSLWANSPATRIRCRPGPTGRSRRTRPGR